MYASSLPGVDDKIAHPYTVTHSTYYISSHVYTCALCHFCKTGNVHLHLISSYKSVGRFTMTAQKFLHILTVAVYKFLHCTAPQLTFLRHNVPYTRRAIIRLCVHGTLTAANAQRNNYCLLDDLAADILDVDAVSGTISNVPGPCLDSNAYSASSAGSSVFINQLKNRLGGAYCVGVLVNRSPGAPDPGEPVVIFYCNGTNEIGSLTVTSTSIIYTIDGSTVVFPRADRVGFNFFQLCTNGTTITLYDECGALDLQRFSHSAFGDNDAVGLLRDLLAPPGFR